MEPPASELVRPWNKGPLVGQKRPLLPRQVWSIRVRLELSAPLRDVALFNLAIDSKLRACDLVRLKIDDIWSGNGRPRSGKRNSNEDGQTGAIRDHGSDEAVGRAVYCPSVAC